MSDRLSVEQLTVLRPHLMIEPVHIDGFQLKLDVKDGSSADGVPQLSITVTNLIRATGVVAIFTDGTLSLHAPCSATQSKEFNFLETNFIF